MTTTPNKSVVHLDTSIVRVGDYEISIDNLTIDPLMSIRDISDESVTESIQKLKEESVSQIIDVVKMGDSLVVINGIRSVMALKAMKASGEISDDIVTVHEVNGSELAVIMHMVNASGEPALKPLEMAMAYYRSSELGVKQCDIAKLFNVTSVQVSNYILLANIPESLQALIKDGVISPTKAHQSIRKNGIEGTVAIALGATKGKVKKVAKQKIISLPAVASKSVCKTTNELARLLSGIAPDSDGKIRITVPAQLGKAMVAAARVA